MIKTVWRIMARASPIRTAAVIAGFSSLIPTPAHADCQFSEPATRDYYLEVMTGDSGKTRIYYSASEKKRRIEAPTGVITILFYTDKKMLIVWPGVPATYWEVPCKPVQQRSVQTGASRRIAGHTCFVWQINPEERQEQDLVDTELCRTAQGVPLRVVAVVKGKQTVSEAVAVTFEPQDPALFRLPIGAVRGRE